MTAPGPREIPQPRAGISASELAERVAARLASPPPLGTRALRTAAALALAALIGGVALLVALSEMLVSQHSNLAWLAELASVLTFAGTTIALVLVQRLHLVEHRDRRSDH
jgi:hypothetical protein